MFGDEDNNKNDKNENNGKDRSITWKEFEKVETFEGNFKLIYKSKSK